MLRVVDVVKHYGATAVLGGVSMDLRAGQCLGLLGRNGSGKSTLARILTGLEVPDRGAVEVLTPGRVLLVQQDFVVWPHLTVSANVEVGLRKETGAAGREAMERWLQRLELSAMRDKKAGELSHGQQQRVALARAFAHRPAVMVLDEVFSNLDAASRAPLIEAVLAYKDETQSALVWIGHEWSVMTELCGRVVVLAGGVVVQDAAPLVIYERPATEDIARLSGSLNVLPIREWNELGQSPAGRGLNPVVVGEGRRCVGVRPEVWVVVEHPEGGEMVCAGVVNGGGGYVHALKIIGGGTVRVWAERLLPKVFRGRLKMKGSACVHVW